jgi:NAD+ synthase (glutamine-hydrolysing)
MRVALAQVNPTVGALAENAALVLGWVEKARRAGASLVAFPELVISGYPPEDLLLKDHFLAGCHRALQQVAGGCHGVCAVVGVPTLKDGRVYNTAAVLGEGTVITGYHKIRLPNYGVFDEKRYFLPGDSVLVLAIGGWRVGVNVCEDIWEPLGPSEVASWEAGATLVVNISMSPYHLGKGREREEMLAERAREAGAYVCYVNGVGGQDELVFDGHSLVFSPQGQLVARAPQFREELLVVDLEPPTGGPPAKPGFRSPWRVEIVDIGSALLPGGIQEA